jgi:hypothetical protein
MNDKPAYIEPQMFCTFFKLAGLSCGREPSPHHVNPKMRPVIAVTMNLATV